jgi:hypothetical protein
MSNADSSPRILPVTRRIPLARSVEARPAMSAEDSVGSPLLRRYRSPFQTRPARRPAPSTSVVKRYPVPSLVSAAHETGSFSFDAGWTGSPSLCA